MKLPAQRLCRWAGEVRSSEDQFQKKDGGAAGPRNGEQAGTQQRGDYPHRQGRDPRSRQGRGLHDGRT